MHKATHRGECQGCGAKQKLPGGRLSKHGYTKRFGFFEGTCPGSGHRPFEQSKDMVRKFMAKANEELAQLELEIAELETSTDSKSVWHRSYTRTRGYIWEKREVIAIEKSYGDGTSGSYLTFVWVYAADEEQPRHMRPDISADQSLDEYVRDMNLRYIKMECLPREVGLFEYIKWQRARLFCWTEKVLIKLER